MSAVAQRLLGPPGLVAVSLAAGLGLAAGPGPALSAALVAVAPALVAASLLVRTHGVVGARQPVFAAGCLAYAAVGAADAAGAGLSARFPSLALGGLLLPAGMILTVTRGWRGQMPGGLGTLPLDAVLAGLAAAAAGDWLIIDPHTASAATRVAFADAELFATGYIAAVAVCLNWPPSRTSVISSAGLLALVAADAVYATRLSGAPVRPGRLIMAAWPLGIVAFVAPLRHRPQAPRPSATRVSVVLPSLAAAVCLPEVIVTAQDTLGGSLAAATLALAGVRLVVSLVENARLLDATRASATRQAEIARLGRRALAGAPVPELAEDGMRAAVELTGADAVAFVEVGADGMLRARATVGWPELLGRDMSRTPVIGGDALRLAARTGEAVIVRDVRRERTLRPSPAATEIGAQSAIAVAIPRPDGVAWGLTLHARRPHVFTPTDGGFLQSLLNVLAAADASLATETEIRELARARERLVVAALRAEQRARQRVSETLHDTALQELLAAGQDLDEAELALADSMVGRIRLARSGVGRAARDLRDAVTELHPVVLEQAGLGPALDAVAQRQAARAGFTYELDVDDGVSGAQADLLLSLVRELLGNVARHAEAGRVAVRVRAAADGVTLEVQDDGRGVDLARLGARLREGTGGLASWSVRVEALGGTLAVLGADPAGTLVRTRLPPRDG